MMIALALLALAQEKVTYANTIAALVEKKCGECHGPKSPTMAEFDKDKDAFKKKDLGPRYDTYVRLWQDLA